MGGNRGWLVLVFSVAFAFSLKAQDRYVVYFKYKPQTSLSLERPQEFLTQKSLDRRSREGVQADSLDLPVSEKYLAEVGTNSEYILYASKWMNAAVVVTDQNRAEALSTLDYVEKVELVGHGFATNPSERVEYGAFVKTEKQVDHSRPKLNSRELDIAENSYDLQNQLIDIDQMHEEGYSGSGIFIAVFDAGFPGVNTTSPFAHLIANGQIMAQKDWVMPWNTEVFRGHQHGTNVLSLIAANEPGSLVAGAYDADFFLAITEEVETEYRIEELNWVRAAEYADSLGVDIINSSLGYWDFDDADMNYSLEDLDGETAVITRGATIASGRGILVVNSVGNYGSRGNSSLIPPADAEDIIAVGSVNTAGEVSSFSSRGPTGDGRFKPELVAYGESPILIRSNGEVGSSSGTSYAAPQITALAAGLWQARPDWTKAELMENLFRSGSQYENPDNLLGYGIPNFYDALYGEILGIEHGENLDWKMYPNPLIEDELSVVFGKGLNCTFELIDLTGKNLMQSELSRTDAGAAYRVRMEGINPGVYVIILQEGALIRRAMLLRR